MYTTYLWKVKSTSSFLTPWQSDTIYGHMLWAVRYLFGEEEIAEMIEEFKSFRAPFICSDGFFDGELPMIKKENILRSHTKNISQEYLGNSDSTSLLTCIRDLKRINGEKTVNIAQFQSLRGDKSNYQFIMEKLKKTEIKGLKKPLLKESSVMHNTINRLTGTTGENGIYTLNEKFTNSEIWIFIKLRANYPEDKFEKILNLIEKTGFGKKISSGKGQIERISFEKFEEFQDIKDSDGYITFSNFVPKSGDYSEIIHATTLTKRGKIANEGKTPNFPFKKPFVCYSAGSVFRKGDNRVPGKILENLHIDKDVVQIGIPFILEVKL